VFHGENIKTEHGIKKKRIEKMRLMMKVFAVIGLVLLIVHPAAHALSRDQFPPDFVFGASTSAYQVLLCLFYTLHCPSFLILCWICDWRAVKGWRCSKWRWQEAKHMGYLFSCWKWYYPLLTTLICTLCFISFLFTYWIYFLSVIALIFFIEIWCKIMFRESVCR